VVLETENATKVVSHRAYPRCFVRRTAQPEVSSPRTQGVLTLHLAVLPAVSRAAPRSDTCISRRACAGSPTTRGPSHGQGQATISLQATLVNELADLQGVTVHLVVGVPTFMFKETVDPMACSRR
jgi:hypothetical protein